MDGRELMTQLAERIDARRWDKLPELLHPDFRCRYVHTGESFDRDSWVRLNAEYPGFQRFVLEDCVGQVDRAAGRSHVTGESGGRLQHFAVATFITVRDGVVGEMTEVWTDVDLEAQAGARPPTTRSRRSFDVVGEPSCVANLSSTWPLAGVVLFVVGICAGSPRRGTALPPPPTLKAHRSGDHTCSHPRRTLHRGYPS